MSTARLGRVDLDLSGVSGRRAAATACIAIAVGAYLSVLYDVVTVVGDTPTFLAAVVASVVLAGVLRALPSKYAFGLASTLLVGGLAFYLLAVPPAYFAVLSPSRVLQDTVALLTGYSVMRMPAAGVWAVAVAPAPTFLAAYFTARTEYARAAGVASLALGFFVLTGDSTTTTTLVGVLAVTGAVGFGTLAAHGASARQTQVLAAVLALMIVGSATVTAVPGGRSPLVPSSTTASAGSLVSADGYVGVGGSLRLDPKVQFVVESDEPSYYRASVYDRFTGNGWVQTADVSTDKGAPPPTGERIEHRITAKRTLDLLPSAPVPQSVSGVDATITESGLLLSGPTLRAGDSYTVSSRTPTPAESDLADARGETPQAVRDTYLQLPDSTSENVVDLADRITEDADSNYRQATAIEQWLEANKEYSLDARGSRGNLVNDFVLNREIGYCTYYASSMVVMLRSQGVPARFVTGYTEGQRVGEDEWVVRGVDSHAWVEVYVPDRGWIRFDPTPATERTSAEDDRVQTARENGVEGVDAAGSENGTWAPATTTTPTGTASDLAADEPLRATSDPQAFQDGAGANERNGSNVVNVTAPALDGSGGSDDGPTLPPLSTLAVWAVLLVGLTAVLRFTGLADRAYRALWLRWLPDTGDPVEEVEAAFERVEYVLGKRYRPRNAGETVRNYVVDVRAGDRAERVANLRERARYAGRVDEEDAAEAKRLARSLAAEYSRLPEPWR
ncbi:transglutaminase [Halobacterium sp. DL1]|nr:transglutaminase [Halobacterium sp. DL1]